jgi:undecaprenyl-diphosphatase
MHWMSDTLMGWAVGAAFTYWLAHIFARRGLMFTYDEFGRLKPRRISFAPMKFIRPSRSHGQSKNTPERT